MLSFRFYGLPKLTASDRANFVSWVKGKKGEYDYHSNSCLIAKYLTDRGLNVCGLGIENVNVNGVTVQIPRELAEIALAAPHTYEAALKRLNTWFPERG